MGNVAVETSATCWPQRASATRRPQRTTATSGMQRASATCWPQRASATSGTKCAYFTFSWCAVPFVVPVHNVSGAAVEVDVQAGIIRPEKVVYEVADVGIWLLILCDGRTVTMRSHRSTPGKACTLIPTRFGIVRTTQACRGRAFRERGQRLLGIIHHHHRLAE